MTCPNWSTCNGILIVVMQIQIKRSRHQCRNTERDVYFTEPVDNIFVRKYKITQEKGKSVDTEAVYRDDRRV